MRGIYIDGHLEWKDPEVYFKERFIPHQKEIDEPGNEAHEVAAKILQAYGEMAADIAELANWNQRELRCRKAA